MVQKFKRYQRHAILEKRVSLLPQAETPAPEIPLRPQWFPGAKNGLYGLPLTSEITP